MNGLTVTREAHRRILSLVAAEEWGELSTYDEWLLHSMLVTGHIALVIGENLTNQIKLRMTPDGWRYLSHLNETL
jgi:hypothetical protein